MPYFDVRIQDCTKEILDTRETNFYLGERTP